MSSNIPLRKIISSLVAAASTLLLSAQCTTTNGTGCLCEVQGQTDCDLLPDITISWKALESYAGGPNEYAQNDPNNPGRLRITGSTPNIGHGALNVRGVDQNGYRWFLCGDDTTAIYDPSANMSYSCPSSDVAKQLIVQRVYHKSGNAMTFTEHFAGTMTYHPTHGHNHVDDWATFTLRIEDPNEPDPTQWPIVGTGAKVGFCLMDYYSCANGSADGHCRTSQEYGGGTALNNTSDFPNYGHGGGSYNCSQISQGISSGYTDVYSEGLDGMWVNIPPGTCNGDYWVVMEVDPNNNFVEEDDDNNWTAIPVTLTEQEPAGGDFAHIIANGETTLCAGGEVELTATAGTSYLWSNGATTQTISPDASGNYSCTVTGICGTDDAPAVPVTVLNATEPVGTGATINAPGTALLQATGNDVHWYDQEVGGTELGTGNSFTTPVISTTTTYYAENRAIAPGMAGNVGKADNTGSGNYGDYNQYLIFDAFEAFTLNSVKVYANGAGNRTFQVLDPSGSLIQQTTVSVPDGESRVTLNLEVPQGINLRMVITATRRDLYRNNGGVNYPYNYGGLVSIKNSSAGSQWYYFCYDWEVSKADVVCTSARTPVTATFNGQAQLNAKVLLDGPFDEGTGLMKDDLRSLGLIPSTEPYSGLGFSQVAGGGGETTTAQVLAVTGPNAVVDWVRVELRSPSAPDQIVATQQGLLQRDGDVVAADGTSPLTFGVGAGSYHIAVRHRNHLGCMSASAVQVNASATALDLSLASSATWGTEARKAVGPVMVLWSGNSIPDDQLSYTGSGNDRDPILTRISGGTPTSSAPGYFQEDTNLDGVAKYTGSLNDRDLILLGIGGNAPTSTRTEQLP